MWTFSLHQVWLCSICLTVGTCVMFDDEDEVEEEEEASDTDPSESADFLA